MSTRAVILKEWSIATSSSAERVECPIVQMVLSFMTLFAETFPWIPRQVLKSCHGRYVHALARNRATHNFGQQYIPGDD
jgi:hypothetical protein